MSFAHGKILIVDDETDYVNGLARIIAAERPDIAIYTANSGEEALAILEPSIHIILLDLTMPDMNGMEVMAKALEQNPNLTIIILTAHGTVETAVSALKKGAWDFLSKPVRREDLIRAVNKALECSRLKGENERLRRLMKSMPLKDNLIGMSSAMKRCKDSLFSIASSAYTVLVRGESGTGKELAAKSIHHLSDRKNNSLISINCPAIPEQLLESELFGHVKGAFTGATVAHDGLFIKASNGTLLLDEIGDIPFSLQTKLLRVLQDGEIRPVGSNKNIRVNARIIAMTNQDLEKKIRAGTFREDLYYRLNVLSLHIPPLRERRDDVPLLAAHFLTQACNELATPLKKLSPAALAELCSHDWPGNVRELQNVIRRMAVFSNGTTIDHAYSLLELPHSFTDKVALSPYKEAKLLVLDNFTRDYMTGVLSFTGGNISEAARISGIERVSLQKILRRINLTATSFKK